MLHNACGRGRLLWLVACIIGMACGAFAQGPTSASPRTVLRSGAWASPSDFVRTWLVCGEFATPLREGLPTDAQFRVGLWLDYLWQHGGEATIRPYPGMRHARPDGTSAVWTEYTSDRDVVDLTKAFAGRPTEFAVGYAYTRIYRRQAGKLILSVGSDDGVRVWLNGQVVVEHLADRGVRADDDTVEVPLRAGDNALLVKVETGKGAWGFCLRLLERPWAAYLARWQPLSPKLDTPTDRNNPNCGKLVVHTDSGLSWLATERPPVEVTVLGAGGATMATGQAPRSEDVVFDPAAWPDGAYEVRCRVTTPEGRRLMGRLLWYKGDSIAAAQQVVATAATADLTTETGMIHAQLAAQITDRLGDDLTKVGRDQGYKVYGQLLEFAELQRGPQGGAYPLGMLRLAYRDPVDDSPQFCRVYLPEGYDPAKKWPLLVVLHGMDSGNPPYAKGWGSGTRFDGLAERYGTVVIYPHGRGNAWYRDIGEADVLRDIAMTKARLSIDDDRVYLMGYSMGGAGTWHVGTRHPEIFAALAPQYGGLENRAIIDDQTFASYGPIERYYTEKRSSFAQAESLLHVPVFVNHGDADTVVPVEIARYGVRLLQGWGYNIRYWEHPGKGHGGLGCDYVVIPWLLAQRRVSAPLRVRLRAGDLKTASAYWVKVLQRQEMMQFVRVDAEIEGQNRIRVNSENVLEMELTPVSPLIDPTQPVQIVWNGTDMHVAEMAEGRITLRSPTYVPGAPAKQPELEGPIRDVQATPFIIVVGTASPDPLMRAMCARLGRTLAARWEEYQNWPARLVTDADLSPADRDRYSLIIIGGPEENLVARELAGALPLQTDAEGVTIDGQRIPARDAAVSMVYPSPYNGARYVLVYAATSPAGMYYGPAARHYGDRYWRERLWEEVDFCVVDGRLGDWIAGGFFDNAWHLKLSNMELGTPGRTKDPIRKAPKYATATVPGQRLWLSELLEQDADGAFGLFMRDGAPQGGPIIAGKRTFTSGIAVDLSNGGGTIDYDLAGAGWQRLKATLVVPLNRAADVTEARKRDTRVVFTVWGDSKEIYKSAPFTYTADDPTVLLDVDISQVKTLRLEIRNDAKGPNATLCAAFADARLEK